MMRKTGVALIVGLIVFTCALALGANSRIEGRWNCVVDTPDGGPDNWVTIFKTQDGKLTGSGESDRGQYDFKNLSMNGEILSGEVEVEGEKYTFEIKVNGDKFEGKWTINSQSGSITGVRETVKK
jgi:hypothetical protein